MLRLAGFRAMRGLRYLSTAVPTREPGVVGLPRADDTSINTLVEIYNRTLSAVKDVPAQAAYRVNVEKTVKHRLAILQESSDLADIEAKFGIGRIEEVIEIAQDELDLIPHMAAWKPWEVAEGKPSVKIELID